MFAAIGFMGLTVSCCVLLNIPLALLGRENDRASLAGPMRASERTFIRAASAHVRLGILRLTRATHVLVLVPFFVPFIFFRHSLGYATHPSLESIVALACMLIISALLLVAAAIEFLRMVRG